METHESSSGGIIFGLMVGLIIATMIGAIVLLKVPLNGEPYYRGLPLGTYEIHFSTVGEMDEVYILVSEPGKGVSDYRWHRLPATDAVRGNPCFPCDLKVTRESEEVGGTVYTFSPK